MTSPTTTLGKAIDQASRMPSSQYDFISKSAAWLDAVARTAQAEQALLTNKIELFKLAAASMDDAARTAMFNTLLNDAGMSTVSKHYR